MLIRGFKEMLAEAKAVIESVAVADLPYLLDDPVEIRAALTALRKKYGWQMHLADLGAKLTGRFARRTYIKVEVAT